MTLRLDRLQFSLAALICFVLGCGVLAWGLRAYLQNTPNTPVNYWIRVLNSGDVHTKLEARRKLAAMGPEAVAGLITELQSDRVSRRWSAAGALEQMGPNALAAVPFLIQSLTFSDPCYEYDESMFQSKIASTLAAIGNRALPALDQALSHKDERVRSNCAVALGLIGPDARSSLHNLIALTNDKEEIVRLRAAEALWRIDRRSDLAVPILSKGLLSQDSNLHILALRAFRGIGPDAKDAVPVLIRELQGTQAHRQIAALWGLLAIGSLDADAITALRKWMQQSDPELRQTATFTLAEFDADYPALLPALVQYLNDDDPIYRSRAAEFLGKMGPRATSALEPLRAVLLDSVLDVRLAAQGAIERIENEGENKKSQ